ncbi:MAG TPA: hypothetical protein VL687_07905 [Methylomirabilota bacterium]|nr:hypothetical protein [Methylomirabilota bacterium]
MRRAIPRIASLAAAAALILVGIAPAAFPDQVAFAADRGLVVVAQTRYEALPEQQRVHVTIDAVATSYTPNPVDGLAYYPGTSFAVQSGATHIAASSGGQSLEVGLDTSGTDFIGVTVTFAEGVFFQQSVAFRVTFDLPDPGGAPDRNLRISPSIVAFPIWAFGSPEEPGGSVTVILPGGFRPSVQGGPLVASTGAGGAIILATQSLPDPFAFFAYLSADRPGAFDDTLLKVQVGDKSAALKVRAWQDDPDWGTTMAALMTDGLPELHELIGLPYPNPGTLTVEEAATSRLGEYAGVYNNLTGIIRVRYDADAYVGLHEAAHIWFNGDLFRDRWIGEAYAEFYGVEAAKAIGATGDAFELTDALMANKIPLNDWGEIGAVEIGVEEYAYAATYHLALLIFERTDLAGLRSVWLGAHNSEMAYQPANGGGDPQKGVDFHLEGWQQLLDLLDARAGATFDDLWSDWVVNPDEQRELDDRSVARKQYDTVVAEAGAWNLPKDLRYAMGSWNFDDAEAAMTSASAVLDSREQIGQDAGHLHLTPPGQLQELFERDGGMKAAHAEADLQLEALADIAAATGRLAEKETLLESIGLLGEDPDAELASARDLYEADRLHDASRDADQALAQRTGAAEAGQTRVLVAGAGVIVIGGVTFLTVRFRRSPSGRPDAEAAPDEPAAVEPPPAVAESFDEPLDPPA